MTGRANRDARITKRAALAAALAFALAPATVVAQDGQFDLRNRATPTPEPTVVGPVDPENPVIRPRATPRASAPIEVPFATPTAATASPSPSPADGAAQPRSTATRPAPLPREDGSTLPAPDQGFGPAPSASASAPPAAGALPSTRRPPSGYQPRNLDLVADPDPIGLWLGLAARASRDGWRGAATSAPAPSR